MKKMLMLVLALVMVLGLVACGEKAPVEETPVEEIPVEEAPVEEAPVEEAPVEEAPAETEASGIVFTVKVVDEGSNPVVGTMVQICQGELCMMPSATDADGVATFSVTEEGTYEAKLLSLPAGYDYATEEHVFPFGSGYEVTIVLKAVA